MDVSTLTQSEIARALNSRDSESSAIAVAVPDQDNLVVLGVLEPDLDAPNPLEDQDGLGQIYTAHRHAGRDEHRKMQEALGLDEDWNARPKQRPNKYAVVLDVYDHGGQVYSISGEGMQCRFDTTRGAAVWVPDDCAKAEILRRAKVYALGFIISPGFLRGNKYHAILEIPGQAQEGLGAFDAWHLAFDALLLRVKAAKKAGYKLTAQDRARGLDRAKEDVARGCLETYNDWLSGSVYVTAVAAFTVDDAGNLEMEGSVDYCGGFYGLDYAEEELEQACESLAQSLSSRACGPARASTPQTHAQQP
jgi:hypothetical protein